MMVAAWPPVLLPHHQFINACGPCTAVGADPSSLRWRRPDASRSTAPGAGTVRRGAAPPGGAVAMAQSNQSNQSNQSVQASSPTVEVLYFESCPNHERAVALVK